MEKDSHNIYAWKREFYRRLEVAGPREIHTVEPFIRRCFAQEEKLMLFSGFPDCRQQIRAHRVFLDELGLFLHEAEAEHCRRFLRQWMRQHDILYDRHFLIYFYQWQKQSRADSDRRRAGLCHSPEYCVLNMKICRFF